MKTQKMRDKLLLFLLRENEKLMERGPVLFFRQPTEFNIGCSCQRVGMSGRPLPPTDRPSVIVFLVER
jgi:hypothetical protein